MGWWEWSHAPFPDDFIEKFLLRSSKFMLTSAKAMRTIKCFTNITKTLKILIFSLQFFCTIFTAKIKQTKKLKTKRKTSFLWEKEDIESSILWRNIKWSLLHVCKKPFQLVYPKKMIDFISCWQLCWTHFLFTYLLSQVAEKTNRISPQTSWRLPFSFSVIGS